ncbi:hypothetical protein ACFVH0_01500 [Streptomyces sp. NPDC127117]|uniref:hypothetical protein n=1 Tax=Streptomyces sp. NPDC127117 TaxID=3345368 RepID=UPI00362F51AF
MREAGDEVLLYGEGADAPGAPVHQDVLPRCNAAWLTRACHTVSTASATAAASSWLSVAPLGGEYVGGAATYGKIAEAWVAPDVISLMQQIAPGSTDR